jgi:hypothetical protein
VWVIMQVVQQVKWNMMIMMACQVDEQFKLNFIE